MATWTWWSRLSALLVSINLNVGGGGGGGTLDPVVGPLPV